MFCVKNFHSIKKPLQPLLVLLAALGFLAVSVPSQNAVAGNKGYSSGKKIKINRKVHRLGGKQMRASSGHRIKKSGNRTYVKRRSVLDGRYNSAKVKRSNRIYNRNLSSNKKGSLNRRVGERRSGVRIGSSNETTYMSGHSINQYGKRRGMKKKRGMRQLAGSGVRVVKRQLGGNRQVVTTNSNAGVVIINGATSGYAGYKEIAGNGGNYKDDCAYGTYCTIDLGGPKIITFNDTGDIQDGAFAENDNLTDEEYMEKYGSK